MSIQIEHFEHGAAPLWAAVGRFALSREVHRELGGPMYSAPDTHWWVASARLGEVTGFGSLRITGTAAWVDYSYVLADRRGRGVHGLLADARDAWAATHHPDLPHRVMTRRDRWHHYVDRGWSVASERGAWVHGIRVRP